jgi:hypothetical protein
MLQGMRKHANIFMYVLHRHPVLSLGIGPKDVQRHEIVAEIQNTVGNTKSMTGMRFYREL